MADDKEVTLNRAADKEVTPYQADDKEVTFDGGYKTEDGSYEKERRGSSIGDRRASLVDTARRKSVAVNLVENPLKVRFAPPAITADTGLRWQLF